MTILWVFNGGEALDRESDYGAILGVLLPIMAVMTVVVSLRAYVRYFVIKAIGWDDFFAFYGWFAAVIYTGCSIGATRWGWGLPMEDRPAADLREFLLINYAACPFYMTGILSFKVALCLSYLRILPKFWTFYRRVIIFVLISCVLEHIGAILVLLLQCLPVRKFWERDYPGHCLPDDPAFHILAGFTIAYDFVIMLLPMPILYSLQISTQRKIALIGVFSLGIFTTFCSIMRIVNIENGSYDYQTMVVVWACIEVMVGVTIACLPTLTPLIKHVKEKTSKYSYTNGSHTTATTVQKTNSRPVNPPMNTRGSWNDSDSKRRILEAKLTPKDPQTVYVTTEFDVESRSLGSQDGFVPSFGEKVPRQI